MPRIIRAATTALATLAPTTLEHGSTRCGVAVNRRNNNEGEIERLAAAGTLDKASLLGPVDHEVELLLARGANGRPTAVLFGYACHATVLGEQSLHGDWCAPLALAPLPLISSYKSEKSLCGPGRGTPWRSWSASTRI